MKKKQDEKHYKMLRSIASLPHNKTCFDCGQKGPTYINMTIGSFVCTSCSGILRGLNPPQRVKSISMTSFTADEIEMIMSRGNEFCRKTYLAHFDSRRMPEPDFRDDQKKRDFLSEKYERKRWYAAPTEALVSEARALNQAGLEEKQTPAPATNRIGGIKPPPQASTGVRRHHGPAQPPPVQLPTVPPSQTATPQSPGLLGSPTQAAPTQPAASQPATGSDLLADLGGDFFSQPISQANTQPAADSGFANFSQINTVPPSQQQQTASNNLFGAPPAATPLAPTSTPLAPTAQTPSGPAPGVTPAAASNSDKYAALADLDSIFSTPVPSQPAPSTADTNGSLLWSANNTSSSWTSSAALTSTAMTSSTSSGWNSSSGGWAGGQVNAAPAAAVSSNPFGTAPTASVSSSAAPANPFAATSGAASQGNTAGGWGQGWPTPSTQQAQQPAQQVQQPGGGFGAFNSQSGWAQQNWAQPAAANTANPFMNAGTTGSAAPNTGSTNPFL